MALSSLDGSTIRWILIKELLTILSEGSAIVLKMSIIFRLIDIDMIIMLKEIVILRFLCCIYSTLHKLWKFVLHFMIVDKSVICVHRFICTIFISRWFSIVNLTNWISSTIAFPIWLWFGILMYRFIHCDCLILWNDFMCLMEDLVALMMMFNKSADWFYKHTLLLKYII